MRTTPIAATLFALAALCAGYASAQAPNIKPGLWQLDVTMPGDAGAPAMAGYLKQMKAQIASMPPEQRKAWAGLFHHYVFDAGEETAAHIAPAARRALAPMDGDAVRSIRAQLLKRMNR